MRQEDITFRTIVKPTEMKGLIDHSSGIISLGSCFADNIGERLTKDLFSILVNPFGTIYNPGSIYNTIERISKRLYFNEKDIFLYDGRWRSWDCHTKLTFTAKEEAIESLNSLIDKTSIFIQSAKTAIITFGTAYIFELCETNRIVANCHKMPGNLFHRRQLSIEECKSFLERTIESLRAINPEINIITTVSPIRHAADGAHGNFISKATLALAIEEIINRYEGIYYFPSFEIMIDDLRDYRFYADDMKHPSNVAVDYIYNAFKQAYFSPLTHEIAEKARRITKRLEHRATPTTDAQTYERFKAETEAMITELRKTYPEIQLNSCL